MAGKVTFSSALVGTLAAPVEASLSLKSSAAGGDLSDTTNRINLESFQRPVGGNDAAGEVIRIHNKAPNAKSMIAVYLPQNPDAIWDAATNPMRGVASFWAGAHWHAQDDEDGIHGHWSFESPDATQSLQTRLSIDFASWDASNNVSHGGDRIAIYTNMADFTVNANSGTPADPNMMRVAGSASYDALLEFSNSTIGRGSERDGGRRWHLGKIKNTEGAGNSGSDFALRAFDNSGGVAGTAMFVKRSNLNFGFGVGNDSTGTYTLGKLSARWPGAGTHGFYAVPSAIGSGAGSMFYANAFASSDRALTAAVQGETTPRFLLVANGSMEFGSGSAVRDITISRTGAGVLAINSAPIGKKVAVPASGTTAGVQGDWAASTTKAYFYTGDGTTHSWASVALTVGI